MVSKPRSPNYPSIGLRIAVERVKQLYPKVQRGEFTAMDAAEAWGYNISSGGLRRSMASLRQFGLIERKKGDNARLTARALTLSLREPEAREFREALREAALDPDLFHELHVDGKVQNSVAALLHHLVVEKRFTKDGATKCIEVLKDSMGFAGLIEGEDITYTDEIDDDERTEGLVVQPSTSMRVPQPTPAIAMRSDRRRVPLRLVGGIEAEIELPIHMPEVSWNHMLRLLEVMKAGYVLDVQQPSVYDDLDGDSDEDGDDEDA